MLLADADVFWKSPSVYDTLGIVGFVVGILSIWYSWYLARTDIRQKLAAAKEEARAATREEAYRAFKELVALALRHDVAEVRYLLGLARESCRVKEWVRGATHLELASDRMYRVQERAGLGEADRRQIQVAISDVIVLIETLRRKKNAGAGALASEDGDRLERLIGVFVGLDSRLGNVTPEG